MRTRKIGIKHRVVSMFMVLVLMMGYLPGAVLAQGSTTQAGTQDTITTENTSQETKPQAAPEPTDPVTLTVTAPGATVTVVDDAAAPVEGVDQVYTLERGSKVTVTIDPEGNGYVASVTVGGEGQTDLPVKGEAYTVEVQVNAEQEIAATIVQRHQVSVSQDMGEAGSVRLGTEAYTQPVLVDHNGDVPVQVTANAGYQIQSVFFGDQEQTLSDRTQFSGTLTGVQADTVITVSFIQVFTVTVTHTGEGTIVTEPNRGTVTVTVESGEKVTIHAMPAPNNRVLSVIINEVEDQEVTRENDSTYDKTLEVNQNYTVVVTFAPNIYQVTVAETQHGQVETGSQAEHGSTPKVTVTPEAGYTVGTVMVNESEITALTRDDTGIWFELPAVTGDVTVTVTFKQTAAATKTDVAVDGSHALRVDDTGTLYVLPDGGAVRFTTEKMGMRLVDGQGKELGGQAVQDIAISPNTTVEAVELYYQDANELYPDWHQVTDWDVVRVVTDTKEPEITAEADKPNDHGFYNGNFTVSVSVTDPEEYSGVERVEYFVTDRLIGVDVGYDDVAEDQKTQTGTLYTAGTDISATVKRDLTVTVTDSKNNSDHVMVWIKAVDRAGNPVTTKVGPYQVNATKPQIQISIDGALANEARAGNYNTLRTATITYTDRASTFSETAAVDGIAIEATDAQYNPVDISKSAMLTWTCCADGQHQGDVHRLQIVFETDANYTWRLSYTNKAGVAGQITEAQGDSVYRFSVDTKAPEATVSANGDVWSELLSILTFGLFTKETVTATAQGTDATSGVASLLYYKDNSGTALTKEQLEGKYAEGAFTDTPITVNTEQKFAVYARVMDLAGNVTYVGTNGIVYDETASGITLDVPKANDNGYYNESVTVGIEVNEEQRAGADYSGINQISYKVEKDGEVTQEEILYSFDIQNPTYDQLQKLWNGQIVIDGEKNNSDHVTLTVTTRDNTNNVSQEQINLSINVDPPKATVTFGDKAHFMEDGYGYYGQARTATIAVEDRATTFDAQAATQGITFSAVDSRGAAVELVPGTDVVISEWSHDGNQHTATVIFQKDGNYSWNFAYTNKAGSPLEQITVGENESTWDFTVDTNAPRASVTVGANMWEVLLEKITFGLYSRTKVDVTAKGEDDTSPITMEYYKTDQTEALGVDELEKADFQPYEKGFSVEDDQRFVVYLRVTDYAGNRCYVSSDGYIVDGSPAQITLTPEEDNGFFTPEDHDNGRYGIYQQNVVVDIQVEDAEPYSGIQSVEYWVVKDGQEETQRETLFTFEKENPAYKDLVSQWNGSVTVSAEKNNSCDVKVYVRVKDNAQNESQSSVALDLDVVKPTAAVRFDNNKDNQGNGYFNAQRTATIVVTERTHHFNAEKATQGISVTAVDANGKPVEDAYTISPWTTVEGNTPDEATHTATIFFEKDANYAWSFSYQDEAGHELETVNTGDSVAPFRFTVDTQKPMGTVTATSQEGGVKQWSQLVQELTFGFWSKKGISITGEFRDATSSQLAKVEYYKVSAKAASDGTRALTEEELRQVTQWQPFDGLNITREEQFVVYLKIEDKAGNCRYISTDGLILDYSAPMEEVIAPEVTITPQQPINGIYNDDVKVDIQVTDPLRGGTYSGLKTVSYQVLNLGNVTQSGTLFAFEKENPTQAELQQRWSGAITVDSQRNNSNDVKIVVFAQDNAGNSSKDLATIQIDITPPTMEVSYDNNRADSGTYFQGDRTATIVVTERNFEAKQVQAKITSSNGIAPSVGPWTKVPGTGNGDDTKWIATVSYRQDGNYTFQIGYTDLAGNPCAGVNYGNSVAPTAFTVDKTKPTVSVTYNNNAAVNGNYYNAKRTATLVITERNLDPNGVDRDRVVVRIGATDNGVQAAAPQVSAWTTQGDVHTATITYAADALYTFDIDVQDKAGNRADDFQQQSFYIDQTPPALEISGVRNQSANRGDVIPVIRYSDTNYNPNQVSITLRGVERGSVALDGTYEDIQNGRIFTFHNFPKEKRIDDIYTLSATLTDMAGNTSTQTIVFSVNRFGSTYALEEGTERFNGTYVNQPEDVVVREINVDALVKKKVYLFKNDQTFTLVEGVDYHVEMTGGNGQWHQYVYTVYAENFEDDGVYRLTFRSLDEAGNISENTLDTKDTEVSFGVDRTPPIITVLNLESGVTYPVERLTVRFTATDNLRFGTVTVYLDDYEKPYRVWEQAEIEQILAGNGEFTFDMDGNSPKGHKIKIVAVDAAGNQSEEEIVNFYVTTNLLVRLFNNKLLLFGFILLLFIFFLILLLIPRRRRKKKKEEEQEPEVTSTR